jgi:hypothetical protein
MNSKNIDPKLKLVREEIDQVLQKHDVSAYVALGSRTHIEIFMHEASWFTGKHEDGQLRIRTFGRDKQDKHDTISFVINLADVVAHWGVGLLELSQDLQKQLDITHKPFGGEGGFSKDE